MGDSEYKRTHCLSSPTTEHELHIMYYMHTHVYESRLLKNSLVYERQSGKQSLLLPTTEHEQYTYLVRT